MFRTILGPELEWRDQNARALKRQRRAARVYTSRRIASVRSLVPQGVLCRSIAQGGASAALPDGIWPKERVSRLRVSLRDRDPCGRSFGEICLRCRGKVGKDEMGISLILRSVSASAFVSQTRSTVITTDEADLCMLSSPAVLQNVWSYQK